MSTSTVSIIMGRIEEATKESPIVVFSVQGEGLRPELDAVFLTHTTKARMKKRYSGYVGTFSNSDNKEKVRDKLYEVLRNAEPRR